MENKDVTSKIKHKTSAHRHVRSMSSNVDIMWTHSRKKVEDPLSPKGSPMTSPRKNSDGLKSSSSMSTIPKLTSEDLEGPFYEVDLNDEVKKEPEPSDGMKRSRSKKILSSLKDLFVTSPRKSAPTPLTSPGGSPPKQSTPRRFFLNSPRGVPPDYVAQHSVLQEEKSSESKSRTSVEESTSSEILSPRESPEGEDLLRVYKKGRWWDTIAKSKRDVEKVTNLRLLYNEYKRNDSLPYINKQHEQSNPHLTSSQHLIIETIATLDNPKIYQYFLTIKYLLMWDKSIKLDQTLDFSLVDYYLIVHYSFDDMTMENLDVDYYYPRSFFLAPIPAGIFENLTIYPITLNNGKLQIKFARSDINPLSYRELMELFRDGKYRRIIEEHRRTSYYVEFLLFSTIDFILSSFDM